MHMIQNFHSSLNTIQDLEMRIDGTCSRLLQSITGLFLKIWRCASNSLFSSLTQSELSIGIPVMISADKRKHQKLKIRC